MPIPALVGAGLISAGASVANSIGGNLWSSHNQNKQNAINVAEAKKNRDFQASMMHYSNWYNSPAHQLQLMREAGINPAMASQMGFEPSVSPAGAQAQSVGLPPYTPFSGDGVASAYANLQQGKKAEAETKTEDQLRTGKVLQQGLEMDFQSALTDVTKRQLDELSHKIDVLAATVTSINQQTSLFREQVEGQRLSNKYQTITNAWADKTFNASYKKLLSETGKNWQEASFLRQNEQNLQATYRLLVTQNGIAALDFRYALDTYYNRVRGNRFEELSKRQSYLTLRYQNGVLNAQFPTLSNPIFQKRNFMVDYMSKVVGVASTLIDTTLKIDASYWDKMPTPKDNFNAFTNFFKR